MPWKVKGQVELRLEFVERVSRGEQIAKLCREYGISRPTGYLWIKRYRESKQVISLHDRSHRPKYCPHQTNRKVEKRVVELRKEYGWGADKIKELLNTEYQLEVPRITINRIFKRQGLLVKEDCHRPALKRFEKEAPNELWQVDLKGCIGRGDARCEPLSMLDDHSRYIIGLYPTRSSKTEPIQEAFYKTFDKYGLPQALLMDHGVPWWSNAHFLGLTKLSVWLMRQDIKLHFSGYNHPQTQGKVERFHRTLACTVRHKGTPKRFEEWKPLLRVIQREYNTIRPHASLKMKVPASVYTPSVKVYNPRPLPPEYSQECKVVKVDSQGRFRFKGARYFACQALENEPIGVRETEYSLLVYYRKTIIREINLESKKGVQFIV